MRCPNDSSDLIVTDRQEVDVRTCPACLGIWLERDQLDRIIDHAIASQVANGIDDRDGLDELEDGKGRARRRDKYTEDFDGFAPPRKGKRRKNRREAYDEMLEF